MAYPASVFRVLIASPSDVAEERDIAVRTIQEWNDLNSAERQVVLLPLRWETHSTPEYGAKPQTVINRQVVDHCDLVIGVFWTRIGTATDVAESGTVEEIERAANHGKPVMLYFSQSRQDPDQIDIEQLAKLRDFKRKSLPNSLIESYKSHVEFKDKLSRQLEIKVRELLAAAGANQTSSISNPVTDIRLGFTDGETRIDLDERLELSTKYFKIRGLEDVPDYVSESRESRAEVSGDSEGFWLKSAGEINKDYYRQSLTYRTLQLFFRPVSFWISNVGSIGARDVHVDLTIATSGSGLTVISKSQMPEIAPPKILGRGLLSFRAQFNRPEELISEDGNHWSTQFEVSALQPQRQVTMPDVFLVGAVSSCVVTISATIYADTLPNPIRRVLEIDLKVDVVEVEGRELMSFKSGGPDSVQQE